MSWSCDELTVTSWLYDELTGWRIGYVTSWLAAFASATDCQKVTYCIYSHNIHTGFCAPYLADFYEFYISADEHLFKKILACPDHIPRVLLPPPAVQKELQSKKQITQ